jgi:hypothetical protein
MPALVAPVHAPAGELPKNPGCGFSAITHAAVEYAPRAGYARGPDRAGATQGVSCEGHQGAYGRSQVSDKAKPAVLLIRSPRGSGKG